MSSGNRRELLFGAWCVSRYVWLIQSLLGVAFLMILLRGVIGLTGPDRIVASLLGPMMSGLVFWIASITILRGRFDSTQNPVLVIGVWLLAACIRGLSAFTFLGFRNIEINLSPGQMAAGILYMFGWTVLLTYLFASSNFYRLRSLDADALLEVTRRYETRRSLVVHQESVRLNGIIRDFLIPELDALSPAIIELRSGGSRANWTQVSARVGGIVIDQVRSASREVIVDDSQEFEVEPHTESVSHRWETIFTDLRSMELSVWLTTALYAGFGALVAIPTLGAEGYLLLASITCVDLVLLLLVSWLLRTQKTPRFRALSATLTYLAIGVIDALLVPWMPGADQINTIYRLQIFLVGFGLIGGVAASAIRQYQQRWDSYFRHQIELLDHYRQLDAELAREQLRVRRQTSRLLHGPVQGNLAAMTLCLKVHASHPEAEFLADADSAIERALSLLNEARLTLQSTLSEPIVTDIPIGEYLSTLRSAWSGLIRIDYLATPVADSIIDAAPGLRTAIIAIIEEAVTNASRHADARNLAVTINEREAGQIVITVENDGRPVPADFQPGFGLRAFDTLGVRWSLVPIGPNSSRLELLMPLN